MTPNTTRAEQAAYDDELECLRQRCRWAENNARSFRHEAREALDRELALLEAHQMEVRVLHEALERALSHFAVIGGEQAERAASEIADLLDGKAANPQPTHSTTPGGSTS